MANTGAAQGDFARTADTWANQVRILKQNFEQLGAVVGGTFINMLKPLVKALNAAMSHIIAFAQIVSNALGKIFGWTYEEGGGGIATDMEDAADASDDIAGGISDAEKAAKKLKTHLLSIDELNVLEPDDGSGASGSGGGSVGGSAGGGASGGQWTKGESMFKQFESEIDTLYELGEKIGETLTKAMDSINWKKIYKKAEGFGRGLAQFLNGLISPELFGAVGRTIASSLNTAIYAALSFAKTFNFHEFGVSLATAVNEFFRTFDFKSLAEGLNEWVDGIWETITTFVKELSWNDIFDGIKTFVGELDFGTITGVIGLLTIKKIGKFVLGGGLAKFISDSIATSIADKLGEQSVATVLGTGIKALFGNAAAKASLSTLFPKTAAVFSAVSTWVSGTLLPAVSGALAKIIAFITGPWGIALILAFTTVLLVVSNWDNIVVSAKEAWEKVRKTVSEKLASAKETVTQKFEEIRKTISEKVNSAKETFASAFENMRKTLSEKINAIRTKLGEFKDSVDNVIKKIKEFFGFNGKSFEISLPTKIFEGFKTLVGNVLDKIKELFGFNGKTVTINTKSEGAATTSGGFATGGFPQPATYFWAGENGVPEILGTVGGKTAVAGGAEITGIRNAVYDVGASETALLRTAVSLLEVIASKNPSVNIDGRDLVSAYDERKVRNGYSFT